MTQKYNASGTFNTKSWDEKPYSQVEGGPKLARVCTVNTFQGDVAGEGTLEYLMIYHSDNLVDFFGLEQIVGRLGGREGSFVLRHEGLYENGAAKTTWTVVPGSATGELRGLRGQGGFVAHHNQPTPFTLEYEFEK